MAFDEEAWASRGYPDRIDINWTIWRLYPHLGVPTPVDDVGRRVEDGTLFKWLSERFGIARPQHEERFLDYLQRAWNVADYGISHSGLLRLHAHIVEALQQSASSDAHRT